MIKAIVAMDRTTRGIGVDNKLPWKLPSDLAHFKRMTSGGVVVMGYNTMLSLGKPLPGRRNIVVTRFKESALPEGFENLHIGTQFRDVVNYLNYLPGDVWIIGGAFTYELMKEHIDEWVVTVVEAPDLKYDTFLCDIPKPLAQTLYVERDSRDEYGYNIHHYR